MNENVRGSNILFVSELNKIFKADISIEDLKLSDKKTLIGILTVTIPVIGLA